MITQTEPRHDLVKRLEAPLPESAILDRRYVDSFAAWAPAS